MNFSGISDSGIGSLLRLPLRLLPSNSRMPVIQGPLKGKRWIVGSSDHGCWLGSYEYAKQKAFSERVRPGDTVFDLGAHVGFYSLLASVLVGPNGRVFSFEPAPRNLGYLRAHLKLNQVTNCTVLEVAVGRTEGIGYFDMGPRRSMGHLGSESQDRLKVRIVALDELIASGQLPAPNVIKCDIEGGEYDALTGASEILSKTGPVILLATHGQEIHQRCCRFLEGLRYRLISLDGRPIDQTDEVLAIR